MSINLKYFDMDDLSLYNVEFINPPADDYICGHCEEVFKKPMILECCGNHFCEQCLLTEDKSIYVCPDRECESKGSKIAAIFDKKMWKKILSLEVACPFSSQGCLWTGELGKRAEHTNYENEDCKYATLNCTLGCGATLRDKNEMTEHIADICPRRLVSCIYCSTQGEHKFINGEHMEQCIIDCPKNCGLSKFKQSELDEHLQVCPLCVVDCDYKYAGCTRKGLRTEIVAHLEEDVHTHLSLVTKCYLTELKTKDQLIIDQNTILSNELAKLTEIYSQELTKKNQQIEGLKRDMKNMIQLRQKQKEAEINEELKTFTRNFDLKYAELKLNLYSIEPKLFNSNGEEKVELVCLLHSGKNNSKIWKGRYNGIPVVVKKVLSDAPWIDVLSEAHILKQLCHTNVIKMLSVETDIEHTSIILEYMPYGNLCEYLKHNTFLLHQQVSVCRQVAAGLDYLHTRFCMHRKVRVDNVLITKDLHCKINDFSSAKIVSKHDDYVEEKHAKLRVKWSAPEVLRERQYYLKSDVWAFGILAWQIIMSGEEPYPGLTVNDAGKHIIAGVSMSRPKDCSKIFYTIMKKCWVFDPWARPTFEALIDLLDHVKDSHKYTDVDNDFTCST